MCITHTSRWIYHYEYESIKCVCGSVDFDTTKGLYTLTLFPSLIFYLVGVHSVHVPGFMTQGIFCWPLLRSGKNLLKFMMINVLTATEKETKPWKLFSRSILYQDVCKAFAKISLKLVEHITLTIQLPVMRNFT